MGKKICVIGAFGFADLASATGGQPVKTRELYYGLKDWENSDVCYVETYQWKRHLFKMLWQLLRNVPKSDVLIMLPANQGIKVFSWLLRLMKKRTAKLFYDVIGGWLHTMAREDAALMKNLVKMDGIWVETTVMKQELNALGLENVQVIPNFKTLTPLEPGELKKTVESPLRLCTFSRVVEKKGITDAIEAIRAVNMRLGYQVYCLDVYGPVDEQYASVFQELQKRNAAFLSYKGVADPSESVTVLKGYFALLFPTKFFTEGIPGTVIDAYAAGIPVISARWESFADVVDDGFTGYGYEFENTEALRTLLIQIAGDPRRIVSLKENCLCAALKYDRETVLKQIQDII